MKVQLHLIKSKVKHIKRIKQFKLPICGVGVKSTVGSQERNKASLPTRHLFNEKWWLAKQIKCSFALRNS